MAVQKQYRCFCQTHSAHHETHRAEDAHSARTAESGTASYPQSVDSRQSGRPHDQGHDSRKTDQVRTCFELARIILHRLEPAYAVTSVTPITETLTVEVTTVNSFQNHRLTAYGGNLRTTNGTEIDDSPKLSTSNSVEESAKCRLSRTLQMCACVTIRTLRPRRMPSRMTLHRWRAGALTSLSLVNAICSIRREAASSECEKETADDSKSEAELVDGADTLKSAISERMRVIRFPSRRRRHNCCFAE